MALYSGNGAVTGKLQYGGLGLAECMMFAIDSFEFRDSKSEIIKHGPFTDKTEVEVFGRSGRNAVIRWLGDDESPMVTIDLQTLSLIKQQVDRMNDPAFENDERGTPAERVASKFNFYFDRLVDTLEKHQLLPQAQENAG